MNDIADTAAIIRQVVLAAPATRGAGIAAAVQAVPAEDIGAFLHATFAAGDERELLTTALGASPGAASGIVVLSSDDAIDAADAGKAVILVRNETTPDDVLGMQSARGILTTRGGLTSHAAVVARGWGIPAVVGAGEMVIDEEGIHLGDRLVAAGTEISIDGRTGEVFLGAADTTTTEAPPELTTLLHWADLVRAAADVPVMVRANADNSADAAHARHLGAEGIGLCRTEHMFLADDRLPLVRRLILSDDPSTEIEALRDLEAAQQVDFEGILTAMDGLPVTVRLLDPPLHEFLPDLTDLSVRVAIEDERGEHSERDSTLLRAVLRLHERNPMLGLRGVRLGLAIPGLFAMQSRAILEAAALVVERGGDARPEIMVPLVGAVQELTAIRVEIDAAAHEARVAHSVHFGHHVGTMIELPRAAVTAADIAGSADFFSFGTNDLTQTVWGFSRDDVESSFFSRYLEAGIFGVSPFETLDRVGVGRLIQLAAWEGRERRPGLGLGVCGEHGGDPESIHFFHDSGLDYVSCSPFRVPVARLEAGRAAVSGTASGGSGTA